MLYEGPPPYPPEHNDYAIVIPHVYGGLHTYTALWARASEHRIHAVLLERYNPYAYGQMLQSLWNRHGDLIVVEQDIVPPQGAIEGFLACESDWCTHGYLIDGVEHSQVLGCARFSKRLQADHPRLLWQAASNVGGQRRLAHWQQLNEQIIRELKMARTALHLHPGAALHLHDYADYPYD